MGRDAAARVKIRTFNSQTRNTHCGDLVQITLEHETKTVKIQVVEIVVERIFAVIVVNAGECDLAHKTRTSPGQFPKIRAIRMK